METLLNMAEGDTLDFKRDQYPLAEATDEEKSELVKDVLAFANAWKTSDAHIVIGALERPGERAEVVGISHHLNDAGVQQLVNGKTNVPVAFEYVPLTFEGKSVAVVRVRAEQHRPVFLKKSFGKLKADVVYLRRGSSTAEAKPDEIARMGSAAASTAREASLRVQLCHPTSRKQFGDRADLTSKVLSRRPSLPITRETEASIGKHFGLNFGGLAEIAKTLPHDQFAQRREQLEAFRKERALLRELGISVENIGQVLAEDVRVIFQVPRRDSLRVEDELPKKPGYALLAAIGARPQVFPAPTRATTVRKLEDAWEVELCVGKVQPKDTVWSIPFWMGATASCEVPLVARVFGDNLGQAIEVPLVIAIKAEEGYFEDHAEN
ncbi:MAG: ATP-binding protein [Myxococcales bacterium]